MWKVISGRVNPRSTVISALALTLTLSLVCSLSLQHGHADVPVATTAEEIQPLGVGEDAPRFIVRTVEGEPFLFDPTDLDGPAILITFRGGWCPYCNMHLSELRTVIPVIETLGIDVLFLSGDRPEILYESLQGDTKSNIEGLDYAIYSDADARAAIALGIAFRAPAGLIDGRRQKGDDIEGSSMLRHGILPVPAVFAVGADGKIAFAFTEADYKVRLPAHELLSVAEKLVENQESAP